MKITNENISYEILCEYISKLKNEYKSFFCGVLGKTLMGRKIPLIKLGDGEKISVFPEGTRNRQIDGLLPFREGVFMMAKKAGVPIVIVRVTDTDKVKKRAPWRKTRVYVDFVDVIDAQTVKAERSHELSEMVRERMAAAEGLPRVPEIRRTFKYGNH
jgi:hypothetical protein